MGKTDSKATRLEPRSAEEIKELVGKRLLLKAATVLLYNKVRGHQNGGTPSHLSDEDTCGYAFLFGNAASRTAAAAEARTAEDARKFCEAMYEETRLACQAFIDLVGPQAFPGGNSKKWADHVLSSVQKQAYPKDPMSLRNFGNFVDWNYLHSSKEKGHHTFLNVTVVDTILTNRLKSVDVKPPKSIPPSFRSDGWGKSKEQYGQDIGHLHYNYFDRASEDTILWFAKSILTKSGNYEITDCGIRFTAVDSKVQYKDAGVALARKFREVSNACGNKVLTYLLLDYEDCVATASRSSTAEPVFPSINMYDLLKKCSGYSTGIDFIVDSCLSDNMGGWVRDEDGEVQSEKDYNCDCFIDTIQDLKAKIVYLEALHPQYKARRARMSAADPTILDACRRANSHIPLMPYVVSTILEDETRRSELMLLQGLSHKAYWESLEALSDKQREKHEEDPNHWEPSSLGDRLSALGAIAHEYSKMKDIPEFLKAFNSEIKKIVAAGTSDPAKE